MLHRTCSHSSSPRLWFWRWDPGRGNIVATLLTRRTCLLSDVPIAIEPIVYVKLCKSGFMAEADRVEVKRRSA